MLVAGGVPATMPIRFCFRRSSSSRATSSRSLPCLGDQRIRGAVIGIGALNQIVALREAHDDVAAVGAKRHPDEAGRLREVHVVDLLVQLLGEQFGELVLDPSPLSLENGRLCGSAQTRSTLGSTSSIDSRRFPWSARARHRARRVRRGSPMLRSASQRLRPAYFIQLLTCGPPWLPSKNITAPTNEVPLKPRTDKMLSCQLEPATGIIPVADSRGRAAAKTGRDEAQFR